MMMAAAIIIAVAAQKEKLSVLYVGGSANFESMFEKPDPKVLEKSVKERMGNFEKFLRSRFTKVKSIRADQYKYPMSADFDITIFDATPKSYNGNESFMATEVFPDSFDDAVLCIADASEHVTRSVGCKNDWYCLCLNNHAHSWVKDHPIFKGPFKVEITPEMRPTPESTKSQQKMIGQPCPEQLEMWKVAEEDNTPNGRIGMVSREDGYTDSPETEIISGGECAKTLGAIAIGRHGNFFHWGYVADPARLTETGRNVLANAIVYASKFKGQRIIARKIDEYQQDRNGNIEWIDYNLSRDSWQTWEKMNADIRKNNPKRAAELGGKWLPKTYNEFIRDKYPELYDVLGPDPAEYKRYFEKNRKYMRPDDEDRFTMVIDNDCREFGTGNNEIAMLDSAITAWERGGKDAIRGKRLLLRYTLCRFDTPAEYRQWLETYRDKLFFTDAGGFVWLVNSREPGVEGNDYDVFRRELEQKKNGTYTLPGDETAAAKTKAAGDDSTMATSTDEPVALDAKVITDANGDRSFTVIMMIHPGFHAYATVDPSESLIQTVVDMEFPDGITPVGDMIMPETVPTGNATTLYEGVSTFRRKFTGNGNGEIKANVRYQVCDNSGCRMPVKKTVSAKI